jgi:choline-sulfatase
MFIKQGVIDEGAPMKSVLAEKMKSVFYTWFNEMTPRFERILLVVGVISTLLTAASILRPLITRTKPMPVQSLSHNTYPDIFFIVVDALAANDMSMFGYSLPTTPNLDSITQTWTVFSDAQTPTTCTNLSLPTLITGRYPYINNYYYYGDQIISQPGWLSVPNALQQYGYQTWWSGFLTPGYYHMDQVFRENVCHPYENPIETLTYSRFEGRSISFIGVPFIPFSLDQLGFLQRSEKIFDLCDEIDPLTSLLQNKSAVQPFFVYYHFRGVHGYPFSPYPSGAALGKFLPVQEGLFSLEEQGLYNGAYKPEDQPFVDKLRLRYDEAVADQDRRLSDFINSLKQQGLYDSSMIVIIGDHGQNFDDGFLSHCTPLVSEAEAHVPLLIKYPYQNKGQIFDVPVSTIDIAPTILDVAGLNYPESWFDGISLIRQVTQGESNRIVFTRLNSNDFNHVPSEIAATDGKYRLVMRADQLLLFDIQIDPSETVNLFDNTGYLQEPQIQRLQQALANYQQRAQYLLDGGEILAAPPLNTTTSGQP